MTTTKLALERNLLLVGEAPNAKGEGKRANTTFTGGRIAQMGGHDIPRTNLLREWPGKQGRGSAFPMPLARPAAARLSRRMPKRVKFVFVGKRVAQAFSWYHPYFEWGEINGRFVVTMPHTSGINQWWNAPENRIEAASFIDSLVALVENPA